MADDETITALREIIAIKKSAIADMHIAVEYQKTAYLLLREAYDLLIARRGDRLSGMN